MFDDLKNKLGSLDSKAESQFFVCLIISLNFCWFISLHHISSVYNLICSTLVVDYASYVLVRCLQHAKSQTNGCWTSSFNLLPRYGFFTQMWNGRNVESCWCVLYITISLSFTRIVMIQLYCCMVLWLKPQKKTLMPYKQTLQDDPFKPLFDAKCAGMRSFSQIQQNILINRIRLIVWFDLFVQFCCLVLVVVYVWLYCLLKCENNDRKIDGTLDVCYN